MARATQPASPVTAFNEALWRPTQLDHRAGVYASWRCAAPFECGGHNGTWIATPSRPEIQSRRYLFSSP